MTVRFERKQVSLRDGALGRRAATADVAQGLAIVRARADGALTLAESVRGIGDGDRQTRDGYAVFHAVSGYRLTPQGWLLPTLEAARACVAQMLAARQEGDWTGPADTIRHFSKLCLDAHRAHDAFTGRGDAPRRLNARIDEAAYRASLAGLRGGRPCEEWLRRGPQTGWGRTANDEREDAA